MIPRPLSRALFDMLRKVMPDLHPAGTYAIDVYRDRDIHMVSGRMTLRPHPENAEVEYVKYRLTVVFRDEQDQSVMAKDTFYSADIEHVMEWLQTNALQVLGEGACIRLHEYKFTI